MDTRFSSRLKSTFKIILNISDIEHQSISLKDGNQLQVDVFNISKLGLGVYLPLYLSKGTKLEVTFESKEKNDPNIIKLECEVRYCNSIDRYKYKCGLKFQKPIKDLLNKLGLVKKTKES